MAARKFKLDSNPRIREWKVQGTNEDDGGDEVATVVLEVNSSYEEPDDEAEYRYHTYYYLDDMSEDQVDFEGFDYLSEAVARSERLVHDLEEEYCERGLRLRQARALDLRDLASDWAFGPDRMLIEMVADLIENGQACDLLKEALNEVVDGLGGDHVTAN